MGTPDDNDEELAWPAGIERAEAVSVRGEHLRVVVTQGGYIFLGNLAAGSLLLAGAWGRVPDAWLLGWFAVLALFNVLRWAGGRQFPDGKLDAAEVRVWDRRVVTSALFSGFIWGAVGGLFFLPGDPAHNFFLTLLIVGMGAAGAISLSYHYVAYPAFFMPAIIPITVFLLLESGTAEKAAGLVMPFYFLLMYLLSRHIYRAARAAILARFQSQHLAYYDAMTGIANRRAFEEVLAKEWLRGMRYRHPLSLVIADIDDFKHFNDTFGHAVGDEVLTAVAKMMEGRVRRGIDLAARIGGEEFALILPETGITGAQTLAEEILGACRRIKSASGRHADVITLSLGISAAVPSEAGSMDALFEQADAALRTAKRNGKDRVETAPVDFG